MTKNEFLKLQEEDIKTSDNEMLKHILECFKTHIPADAIIRDDKSVAGMYDFMKEYARQHQKDGMFCIDPFDGFKKLAFEYLGIKESENNVKTLNVSLEDIFA